MLRLYLIFLLLTFHLTEGLSQSMEDMAEMIKEGQMKDDSNDWVFYGDFNYTMLGVDNEITRYLEVIEANTTVRMYLLAKTDCIVYFDVTNKEDAYVFGTRDATALESDLGDGFKGATSIFTFDETFMMNINVGIRWGCPNMINTEMKLLVFYAQKASQ